jgi:hypothetical protein
VRVCDARRSQHEGRDRTEGDVPDRQHTLSVGASGCLRRLRKGFVRSRVVP